MFSKKEFAVVNSLRLIAGQISCSAELSMKKVLKPRGLNSITAATFIVVKRPQTAALDLHLFSATLHPSTLWANSEDDKLILR